MLLTHLARLRPLFLMAVVLSWNALFLAREASATHQIPTGAVLVLAVANLALAVIAGCVKESNWASNLAVRPEIPLQQVRPILWIITSLSLAFGMYGFVIAWELPRS